MCQPERAVSLQPSLQLLQEASGNVLHINMGDCLRYNMSREKHDNYY